jgi:hypothetical protein
MSKHPAGSFPSPSPQQKTRAACLLATVATMPDWGKKQAREGR